MGDGALVVGRGVAVVGGVARPGLVVLGGGGAGRGRLLVMALAQDRAGQWLDLDEEHCHDDRQLGHVLKIAVAPGGVNPPPRRAAAQSRSSRSAMSRFISAISRSWAAMIESASSRTRGSVICARREVSTAIEWCGIIAFM